MSIVTRTLGNRPAQPNASRETERAVSSRVDLHVKLLDARVVARAKARGIDVLVYAPHFCDLPTIRARARRCSDAELLVVPARELFTGGWRERVHVLAIDPPAPIPDFCELDAVMAELAAQDVATLVPHPEFATVSFDAPTIDRYADQLHGLEVYNPKHRARHNRNAAALVETTGLAPFASSYAHRLATIGEVWTTFERTIDSADALSAALVEGAERQIEHRTGAVHRLRCELEFGHLAWENSWQKAKRVVGSGVAATHPTSAVYEGRFDAVAAYRAGPDGEQAIARSE